MSDVARADYDALLIVSFGGPEGREDVMPFLENVLRGKNVPRERMLEVAEHYYQFGGVSPINQQCRDLIAALRQELRSAKIDLPIYWGNRNWHPMLRETVAQMQQDGIRRALSFFTSMYSSYSGCRQYRENLRDACQGLPADSPQIEKLRFGFNHPGFVGAMAERVEEAAQQIEMAPDKCHTLFTAHSIPLSMAENCDYQRQLLETGRLVADASGLSTWELVYQSRSGPPQQPWLEPDVCARIETLHAEQQIENLLIVPIGFTSDHVEVLFDLDEEAAQLCEKLGIRMARAGTAGTHPQFITMIRQLIEERLDPAAPRLALGTLGPWHDVCPSDCCLYTPARRPAGS